MIKDNKIKLRTGSLHKDNEKQGSKILTAEYWVYRKNCQLHGILRKY